MGNRLAEVRGERGWKKARLLLELRAAAARRNETLPKDESLSRRVAGWENQGATVSEFYRDLLCDVYECERSDLGLVDIDASRPRPVVASATLPTFNKIDVSLVGLLRCQTHNLRLLDRRLGSAAIYQQTVAHIEHLEHLVRYALPGTQRDAAADVLAQTAALAGWQALDSGLTDIAWRHHELAVSAAHESGVAASLAYASAERAYILLEAGHPSEAHSLVVGARQQLRDAAPDELRAWLHAAEGEVLAVLGERDAALRALDAADAVLPDTGQGELPYVMLDAGHLARWRGHCLARLGEDSAIDDLWGALSLMGEGQYGRAEVSTRVDLALALRARGDVKESQAQARQAQLRAGQTGSERQRRRITRLLVA